MHIVIENHEKSFNIGLSGKEGRDPFLVIKGCRVVDGPKGRFVSLPSKKLDSGKYWNHVWASEAFQAEVLKAYDATQSPRKSADESEVPF